MTRRPLDPDEDALWRRATKDVSPLAGRDKAAAPAPAPRKSGKRALLQSAGRIAVGDGERGAQGLAAQKSANAKSVIGGGDPAADKRAARRRVEIARTLDLHGDTVAAGRNRLLRFLRAARMEGAVCVLVITGKGGAASAAAMTRTRLGRESDDAFWARPRGVLRRAFLEWVDEPDIQPMIARVSKAHGRRMAVTALSMSS